MEFSFSELASAYFCKLIAPVKLCLCIRIFCELKLLNIRIYDGRLCCTACDGGFKTELSHSPLFRLLWDAGDSATAKEKPVSERKAV